ncbi:MULTISPECIES: LUD domain-containing protein [unclassified Microbulbifer]|uniref:LutC/YkgG family protein n=1 Tax=unclassified Microbulbifer TaxID=2619833 RepID=UPI0027E595DF|nr:MULTISPECIES: LUD domain-containing protein [unclassified Microbulbifer]
MSKARERIFAAIRRNKKPLADAPVAGEGIAHADTIPTHTIPAGTRLTSEALYAEFEHRLSAASASVERVESASGIPAAVWRHLSDRQRRAQCFANGSAAELDWASVPELDIRSGAGDADTPVCITSAFRGIAETGSLVLLSAPGHSSASYFLPELLIVILSRRDILATQEAVWADLRRRSEEMPRTVTLVTGPSRTGDIEQKIVLGAHGPRQVHVLLVN